MCGFFKRKCLGLQKSLDSIPTSFCSQKLWGLIFLALEPRVRCPGVVLGLLAPKISLLSFYPSHSVFCVCTTPTSVDGCGFFSSVVVRLPFNLISEGVERWLFSILVIIFDVVVQRGQPCLPMLPS